MRENSTSQSSKQPTDEYPMKKNSQLSTELILSGRGPMEVSAVQEATAWPVTRETLRSNEQLFSSIRGSDIFTDSAQFY